MKPWMITLDIYSGSILLYALMFLTPKTLEKIKTMQLPGGIDPVWMAYVAALIPGANTYVSCVVLYQRTKKLFKKIFKQKR
jgi:hypothetical protein